MALLFQPEALSSIPREEIKRILQKIEWLWDNRTTVTHFLLGENLSGFYKRRLGKYRIIYTYDSNKETMVIFMAGHRDDIYKKFPQSLK